MSLHRNSPEGFKNFFGVLYRLRQGEGWAGLY